jgi:hypothetical protein
MHIAASGSMEVNCASACPPRPHSSSPARAAPHAALCARAAPLCPTGDASGATRFLARCTRSTAANARRRGAKHACEQCASNAVRAARRRIVCVTLAALARLRCSQRCRGRSAARNAAAQLFPRSVRAAAELPVCPCALCVRAVGRRLSLCEHRAWPACSTAGWAAVAALRAARQERRRPLLGSAPAECGCVVERRWRSASCNRVRGVSVVLVFARRFGARGCVRDCVLCYE